MAGKRFLSIAICFMLLSGLAAGATWYVPDDFPSIQDAINASSDSDTIIVRQGVYVENIDFLGKAVTLESEMGPDLTTIDGNQAGAVATFNSGEGADSVITGFTLTNGKRSFGGGVYCYHASPTITRNVVTGNKASVIGGGVYCENDTATVSYNVISDNISDDRGGGVGLKSHSATLLLSNTIKENRAGYCGGGLTCDFYSTPEIKGNTFLQNHTDAFGGAILADMSSPVLDSNLFHENFADHSGGAVYGHESDISFYNNVFAENQTYYYGGALLLDGSSTSTLTGNTITSNTADFVYGGGLCLWDGAAAQITNTVFWKNDAPYGPEIALELRTMPVSLSIDFSDVDGGQSSLYVDPGCLYSWGSNMIDADPLFVDPDSRDFHLTIDSPCRGAGDPAAGSLLDVDFEGDPRMVQNLTSIGADEFYYHLYFTGDTVPGGSVDAKVVGSPSTPAFLLMGSGLLDSPWTTPYGLYYLQWPVQLSLLGTIPATGVLVYPGTIPVSWASGSEVPFQALTSGKLTNLFVLTVE